MRQGIIQSIIMFNYHDILVNGINRYLSIYLEYLEEKKNTLHYHGEDNLSVISERSHAASIRRLL